MPLKHIRKELKQGIRRAKRGLEKSVANTIKENPKAFYTYMKRKRGAGESFGPLNDKGGNLSVEPEEVGELLNEYFVIVFMKEKELVEDDLREGSVEFLTEVASKTEEVLCILKSIKVSLLLLISASNSESPFENKPFTHLVLACALVVPNVLALAKALWKTSFGSSDAPSLSILGMVCLIEALVAFGTSILVLVCMPHFDIITNLYILNGVCLFPAFLQVVFQLKPFRSSMLLPLVGFGFVFLGLLLFILAHNLQQHSEEVKHINPYVALAVVALIFVSFNWWENFMSYCKIGRMETIRENLRCTRNVTYVCTSTVRILVVGTVVVAWIPMKQYKWEDVKTVSQFNLKIVLCLFGIQGISSALCHWFGVLVCKMHAVRRSFAVPSILATPVVFFAFLIVLYDSFGKYGKADTFNLTGLCHNLKISNNSDAVQILLLEIPRSLCRGQAILISNKMGLALLGSLAVCFWLGLIFSTFYVWGQHIQRIERTSQLFVRRLYEAAFMEQSMLLNTRVHKKNEKKNKRKSDHVMIYLCATMWHETLDEMAKILTSIFRLDKYKPNSSKSHKDNFEFEAHVYFDDAFHLTNLNDNVQERVLNQYVKNLIHIMEDIYRIFSREKQTLKDEQEDDDRVKQTIMETPYGGRITYTLPYGNILYVHLKDKQKIRHKKRWSQIMYMYYLLGWKLNKKYMTLSGKFEDEMSTANALKVNNRTSFLMPGLDSDRTRNRLPKENTYILALDGDTDFQPSALILLVDRLRRYSHVGAACGRIHPTGTGPMVWYQKFEYAVGHWLQKTAEHVLGCVLCSPGCFSLYRAAALMDDNVVKRYTTKATEGQHFIQYDQGEDRWLCTLLLQQGWRVEYNAASDAYTNAPQEFKEFYNQRRRWVPSTLANTIDLLNSGAQTSKRNLSISKLYILYQIIGTAASILGPATVVLMIAGAFTFVFNWNGNVALALGVVPPAIYILICYKVKSDTQIMIAAVMSIFYAFLMIATIMSMIGEMVKENTFITPTGLFFISMMILYLSTAMLHPQEFPLVFYGLLYIICIPSGYLLLPIYAMVNMNNVSWGTRETVTPKKQDKINTKQILRYEKKCKCICWDIEFLVKEDKKELVQYADSTIEEEIMEPRIEDNWISNLQDQSFHIKLAVEELDEEEIPFWNDLIELYLKPIEEDKEKQAEVEKELKSLRNKATFLFFIINTLWIVSTFFLQAIGPEIHIKIPKILPNGTFSKSEILIIEPLSFMFLVSFAGLLGIQFLTMLYHRITTLIHFIAYKGTEIKPHQNVGKYHQMCKDHEV
ncbi:chitin synthase chs-1-like [Stegostoma tigrinum]|uniref:chitin synthase chs-1-like n=1 Tax=Stegostoma tigrinum TaxID=3053191 RepID=UPI00287006F4|nr:chitin synthase chs-1-like [Stegostoma tigrinum]